MAPLPPNNTARLVLHYTANTKPHKVVIRYPGTGAPDAGFCGLVDEFLQALNPMMPLDWALTGQGFQDDGTNVELPFTFPFTPFAGTITTSAKNAPAYYTFVGRSALGRRFRLFILGAGNSPAADAGTLTDYRWYAAENSNVDNAIDKLAAAEPRAIDGQLVNLYSYINLGYNYHWTAAVRS